MIFVGKKEAIKNYFESPRLSQSLAKVLAEGLDEYKKVLMSENTLDMYFEEPKDYLINGSAIDTMITRESAFFEEYYVSQVTSKPSDKIISIVNYMLDKVRQMYYEDYLPSVSRTEDGILLWNNEPDVAKTLNDFYLGILGDEAINSLIVEGCKLHEYQSKWGIDAKIKAVRTANEDYILDLIKAEGKQILAQEDYDKIINVVTSLRTHPIVSKYFDGSFIASSNVDILFQVPMYFKIDNIEVKALVDMITVDHTEYSVQAWDLKTMSDKTLNFYNSFVTRGYDIQAAWYNKGLSATTLQEAIKNHMEVVIPEDSFVPEEEAGKYDLTLKKFHNNHATVLDQYNHVLSQYNYSSMFKFIVESTTHIGTPFVFDVTAPVLTKAYEGNLPIYSDGVDKFGKIHTGISKKLKLGIKGMLNLYMWYCNNGFDVDYRIAKADIVNQKLVITTDGLENAYELLFESR